MPQPRSEGLHPQLGNQVAVILKVKESEREVAQSCPTLCDPVDCSLPGPLSMGLSRQEYWSGLPFPSPGDLPNPGIERGSPALEEDALTSEPPGKPAVILMFPFIKDQLCAQHFRG